MSPAAAREDPPPPRGVSSLVSSFDDSGVVCARVDVALQLPVRAPADWCVLGVYTYAAPPPRSAQAVGDVTALAAGAGTLWVGSRAGWVVDLDAASLEVRRYFAHTPRERAGLLPGSSRARAPAPASGERAPGTPGRPRLPPLARAPARWRAPVGAGVHCPPPRDAGSAVAGGDADADAGEAWPVACLATGCGGRFLAACFADGVREIIDVPYGSVVAHAVAHYGGVAGLAWDPRCVPPHAGVLYSGAADGCVFAWQVCVCACLCVSVCACACACMRVCT